MPAAQTINRPQTLKNLNWIFSYVPDPISLIAIDEILRVKNKEWTERVGKNKHM